MWKKVVFASDLPLCECCEEPWCPECEEHYADCGCFGPTQDDLEYAEIDGVLFARELD